MGDDARVYVDEQLKRQALQLGLSSWKDDDEDAPDEEVLKTSEVELEQLRGFAGLRGDDALGVRVAPLDGFTRASGEGESTHDGATTTTNKAIKGGVGIDLAKFWSPVELEELGMDAVKAELTRLGLKCGGTLVERCKRLFEVKKVSGRLQDLDPSLFANNGGGGGGRGGGGGGGKRNNKKPRRAGDDADDVWDTAPGGRRWVPQQGPLLPGQGRKKRKK